MKNIKIHNFRSFVMVIFLDLEILSYIQSKMVTAKIVPFLSFSDADCPFHKICTV